MNPIAVILIQQIVSTAPGLAIDLIRLFSKDNITDEDWAELKKRFMTTYDEYIAKAKANAAATTATVATTTK